MVTSPDGMGIIIVGGYNQDSKSGEKRILESRFDGSKFLPWQVMKQKLQKSRSAHVVIPIPNSITNCNLGNFLYDVTDLNNFCTKTRIIRENFKSPRFTFLFTFMNF